jgi:hypothetical protein
MKVWPRPLSPVRANTPTVFVRPDGELGIAMPADVLMADVANYPRVLAAYLRFDFLRRQDDVDPSRVYLCTDPAERSRGPRIFLRVQNDILESVPYLHTLIDSDAIPAFALYGWSSANLSACQEQSWQWQQTFNAPPRVHLYEIPDKSLMSPMADFLAFKSATDGRIRKRIDSALAPLSVSQAKQLAQDILVVSRFYTLPLDSFLGIGAMENNYMSVRGDLGHQVWKRRAQRGDVVVKRRHGRVLVQNYSLGVWQITRETLRYAELLCLRDQRTRDYGRLPARLRPRFEQDPDDLQPETLTTYAGLFFRSLLDHFDGNVTQAVGAYNGGAENPNLAYAESVRTIAQYAHRVIANAARVETGGSI